MKKAIAIRKRMLKWFAIGAGCLYSSAAPAHTKGDHVVRCDLKGGGWYRLDFGSNHRSSELYGQMCDVVNQRIRDCKEGRQQCQETLSSCIAQREDCTENARAVAGQALGLLFALFGESQERREAESALNEVCSLIAEHHDDIPEEARESLSQTAGCEEDRGGTRIPYDLDPDRFRYQPGQFQMQSEEDLKRAKEFIDSSKVQPKPRKKMEVKPELLRKVK